MPDLDQIVLDKLGIKSLEDSMKIHDTLDELKQTTPGFVTARVISDSYVSIAHGKHEHWKIDDIKVMNLGMYFKSWEYKTEEKTKRVLTPYDVKFKNVYKRYNGEDLNNKTIFIWRTGGIGDILFIQPCMKYIKEKYPTCKIWFSCSHVYFPLISQWSCIDQMFHMPFNINVLLKADYHCAFEGVIERCKEAETTNAYKLFSKWMNFNIPNNKLKPELKTKKNNDKYVKKIMKKLHIPENNFIYVQPKASVMLRTPGIGHWQQILANLIHTNHIIVFNDSPKMWKEFKDAFEKNIRPEWRKNIKHFSQFSENISIAMSLMKYSKLVIAPDSSAIHLAAGLGKPCYGIYAPFPGHIRMSTYAYNKCNWSEPVEFNICKYMGKNCCLHKETVCPEHKNYTSPCFDLLNYTKVTNDINDLLNKKRNRK